MRFIFFLLLITISSYSFSATIYYLDHNGSFIGDSSTPQGVCPNVYGEVNDGSGDPQPYYYSENSTGTKLYCRCDNTNTCTATSYSYSYQIQSREGETLCEDGLPEILGNLGITNCDRPDGIKDCGSGDYAYSNQVCGGTLNCYDLADCTTWVENYCLAKNEVLEQFTYTDPSNLSFVCVADDGGSVCDTYQPRTYCGGLYLHYGIGYEDPTCAVGNEMVAGDIPCETDGGGGDFDYDLDLLKNELQDLNSNVEQTNSKLGTMTAHLQNINDAISNQTEVLQTKFGSVITLQTSALDGFISDSTTGIRSSLTALQNSNVSGTGDIINKLDQLNNSINNLDLSSSPVDPSITPLPAGTFEDKTAELDAVKLEYEDFIGSIKTEMDSLFSFSSITTATLTCNTTLEVMGASIPFCISDYQDQLSLIAQGLVLGSLIASGLIMMGGIRV